MQHIKTGLVNAISFFLKPSQKL